ncbi:hypothetical protein HJC23_001398 [Cyclotella cryptica]|uniref:Uncharacterized protein n=1 Tax=Cyclotella cryptica TaxID=29204 RepID=A0ABD3P927_9STRA|eukprot:CCRYP_016716-RA/>CCRYP_016716-RA protein AED:0.43 eAED:0.43 QI:0/-1/0/1/-1/1/1/0/359
MTEIIRAASATPCLLQHAKNPTAFVSARQNFQYLPNPLELARSPETSLSSRARNMTQPQQFAIMQTALETLLVDRNFSDARCGLPQEFVRGLLTKPTFETPNQQVGVTGERTLHRKLMGLPSRPFSHEITRRLITLHDHIRDKSQFVQNQPDEDDIMFLPASHFGFTEIESMDSLIPNLSGDLSSIEECERWLRQAGEKGILALLGIRTTIGTASLRFSEKFESEQHLFPPSSEDLLEASRMINKPHSNSSLSVAGRALAKHADRGKSRFFGIVQGSESTKNKHADDVVMKLLREASWINIHHFGGTETCRPIIEVRTIEGYGARWSARWKDAFTPDEVIFRGFLEPQMVDGHEKRWRH